VNTDTSIARSLAAVKSEISRCESDYGRTLGSVSLMAVSKRKSVSAITAAIAAGQTVFGENYVEEGLEKIAAINNPDIEWHFIGAIQSRKTAKIAEHFHWAHGVDRIKVAQRLSDQRPAELPALNICLQVNLDNETGKAGTTPEDTPELAAACAELPRIQLRGLMAIPMPRTDFDGQRIAFSRLRRMQEQLQQKIPSMNTLSMGMSADMQAAIAEGSTIVRVGTAIFGAR
jgi:pyridoxal phosphate enzyme (YggS family)